MMRDWMKLLETNESKAHMQYFLNRTREFIYLSQLNPAPSVEPGDTMISTIFTKAESLLGRALHKHGSLRLCCTVPVGHLLGAPVGDTVNDVCAGQSPGGIIYAALEVSKGYVLQVVDRRTGRTAQRKLPEIAALFQHAERLYIVCERTAKAYVIPFAALLDGPPRVSGHRWLARSCKTEDLSESVFVGMQYARAGGRVTFLTEDGKSFLLLDIARKTSQTVSRRQTLGKMFPYVGELPEPFFYVGASNSTSSHCKAVALKTGGDTVELGVCTNDDMAFLPSSETPGDIRQAAAVMQSGDVWHRGRVASIGKVNLAVCSIVAVRAGLFIGFDLDAQQWLAFRVCDF
eukprot:gnl/Chilomastix_cuspidata/3892.p1 GENE.gnl/Chilomastix_cuspidata/3892~~gnl/Chilomastix_cuspidata/3892.p1  ORF type:complete len:383 (-),score=103.08 gnl/Chilomastix_cuspidata/3892:61-1098(-)